MIFKTTNKLILNNESRVWCVLPYPSHPKGCPNYAKKIGCPPYIPLVNDYFDLNKDHYFVVVRFDLGKHIQKMKKKHPNWSDRQAKCCLYWQNGVNKFLRESCEFYISDRLVYNLCPEAMGIDVIKTCELLGVSIQRKPTDTIFKVAMLGTRKVN